jgi:hypothetical protein
MHVIGTHSWDARVAGGVRLRAPRRAAVITVFALLVLLILSAEAQAYVPGQLIWAKRIGTSTSEAGAWAVAAGPNGAVASAGWMMVPQAGPPPMVQEPMVARYSATGAMWARTYAADGYAEDVAIDRSGNVYVAATINLNSGGDIVVLKYNAAGTFQWATTPYDGTGGGSPDSAREIAIDGAGNVIVAGTSVVNGTGLPGIAVLKYDHDGNAMWLSPAVIFPSSNQPDAGAFSLEDLALGGAGDVYVAGSQTYRVNGVWLEHALVAKFSAGDGGSGGPSRYLPGNGREASFESIAVRGYTVVAAGSTWDAVSDGAENALLRKYDVNLAPGTVRQWGAGNKSQEWFGDVLLDGSGNVYVTGDQWVSAVSGYGKAVAMKFSPSLAKITWQATYMPASEDAEGWYIARDGSGNIYVAGVKNAHVGLQDLLTMKFSPTGVRKWVKSWSGGGPDEDEPNGLVLGTKGGVYVGGQVTGKGDIYQAALLKYQR